MPVPASGGAAERLRQAVPADQESMEARSRRFLEEHPDVGKWIRGLALVLSVAVAIAAIAAALDPVPGDEVAAGSFALWLFRLATAAE